MSGVPTTVWVNVQPDHQSLRCWYPNDPTRPARVLGNVGWNAHRNGRQPWKAEVTSPVTHWWTGGRGYTTFDKYFDTRQEAMDYLWDVCNHYLMMEA